MREVIKREQAKRDLTQIFVYVGERNLDAAERFLVAVDEDLENAVKHARAGHEKKFPPGAVEGVAIAPGQRIPKLPSLLHPLGPVA